MKEPLRDSDSAQQQRDSSQALVYGAMDESGAVHLCINAESMTPQIARALAEALLRQSLHGASANLTATGGALH